MTVLNNRYYFFLLLLFLLAGCLGSNKISVNLKGSQTSKTTTPLNVTISNIQVINHQIIVTGTNLNAVSTFNIKEGETVTDLEIESKSNTSIVANTLDNVSFAAGKIFDFILSNANAASSFTVNFSLCDSNLAGKGFNCSITPNDKEVLSYDAASGKWKPRAINGLSYQGVWDANTAQPTNSAEGDYYIVSVANAPFNVGDWIVFNGTTFDQITNSSAITNVFGRTGAVTANEGDYVLTKMGDVDLTTVPPVANQFLKFDGTNWVPGTVSIAETDPTVAAFAKTALPFCAANRVLKSNGISFSCVDDQTGAAAFSGTPNRAMVTNGVGSLAVSGTTDTELGFLSGVTSGVQAQIDAKLDSSTFVDWSAVGVQTIAPSRLNLTTADRVVVTSATGVPEASAVTEVELGYLSGVTSSIQTQIDNLVTGASANQWIPSGSDIYRTSGRVAVGTSTPTATFSVVPSSTSSGAVTLTTNSSTTLTTSAPITLNVGDYLVPTTTTAQARAVTVGGTGTSFSIFPASTANITETFTIYPAAMNINSGKLFVQGSTGNVGVGTTMPSSALHVMGDAVVNGNANVIIQANDSTPMAQGVGGGINFGGYYNAANLAAFGNIKGIKENATNGNFAGAMVFTTRAHGSALTEAMRITSSGNVGIGATAPAGLLQIDQPTTQNKGFIINATGTQNPNFIFAEAGTNKWNFGYDLAGNYFKIAEWGASDRLAIKDVTGYVGIGTSDPQTSLDVNGPVRVGTGACSAAIAGAIKYNAGKLEYCDDLGAAKTIGTANSSGVVPVESGGTGTATTVKNYVLSGPTTGADAAPSFRALVMADLPAFAAPDMTGLAHSDGTDLLVAGDTLVTMFNKLRFTQGDYISKTANQTTINGTMTINSVSGFLEVPTPVSSNEAANKGYVDSYGQWIKGTAANVNDIYFNSGKVGIGTATPQASLNNTGTTILGTTNWPTTVMGKSNGRALIGNEGQLTLWNETYAVGNYGELYIGAKNNLGPTDMSFAGIRGGVESSADRGSFLALTTIASTDNSEHERMRITASGNVGIGTTAPTSKLHVQGGGASTATIPILDNYTATAGYMPGIRFRQSNSNTVGTLSATVADQWLGQIDFFGVDSGNTAFRQAVAILAQQDGAAGATFVPGRISFQIMDTTGTSTERMTIKNNGKVGIGTTDPGTKLHLREPAAAATQELRMDGGAGSIHRLGWDSGNKYLEYSQATGSITLANATTSDFVIKNTGNVGIGTDNPQYKLQVGVSGDGTVAQANAWNTWSDERLKRDFEIIPDSLEKLLSLNGYYYYWNRGSDHSKKMGVKAQEVEKVFPEVVSKGGDGFLSVSYDHLVAAVIEAVKEFYQKWFDDSKAIHREIASVKAENEKLKQENAEIKARLDKIEKALNSKQ